MTADDALAEDTYDEYGFALHCISPEVEMHCGNDCPWDSYEMGRKCPQLHWCP